MGNAVLVTSDETRLHSLDEGEVRAALARHNPQVPTGEVRTMAKIIALVSDVLADLPESRRREIVRAKGRVREALIGATATPVRAREARSDGRASKAAGKVERSEGSGLGERIELEEGRARLDRYAVAKPLESWAGPVAGAGGIEQQLGIPRSTLNTWQKRGAVIGLLRGERKLAYPLEQFVDARPMEGIGAVLEIARDPRAAWLWLRQPHGALNGRAPLEVLRSTGERERVVQVAERDFV
jgi:Protein of unknown function (DUF2384)